MFMVVHLLLILSLRVSICEFLWLVATHGGESQHQAENRSLLLVSQLVSASLLKLLSCRSNRNHHL